MKINVGVFFGGRSVEHEISVISALQAINAFNKDKYLITPIYISKQGKWFSGEALFKMENYKNLDSLQKKCEEVFLMPAYGDHNLYRKNKKLFGTNIVTTLDVVMPVLHGTNGEDGIFQGLLELTGIPYVGCNPLASANGMDKITMKMILKESGIPTVDYVWFTDKEWFTHQAELTEKIEKKIGYPVIVKPGNLGSSVGISSAANPEELHVAINTAKQYSTRIIVEKMITDLKEINCSVLGDCNDNITSVCEEPFRSGDFLSYKDKYLQGSKSSKGMQSTKREFLTLAPEITAKIQKLASETFRVLACNGVSRVDFLMDKKTNDIYVNEINTIPGSLSFYLWEATNISFDKLVDKLIDLAFKRNQECCGKTISYDQNIFNISKGPKQGGKMGGKM